MKKCALFLRSFLAVLLAGGIAFLAGCESTDETSTSLTVSPSRVTFQANEETVTFSVSGSTPSTTTGAVSQVMNATLGPLSMPLVWAVSNPGLGTIVESSGNQAVYQRTSNSGVNIVTVEDQYGQEGIATVNQPDLDEGDTAESLNLSASPNPIPNGQVQSVITVVNGGSGSFTWSVDAPGSGTDAGGSIVSTPANSSQETYQSSNPGANVVRVTDSEGVTGTITITQE